MSASVRSASGPVAAAHNGASRPPATKVVSDDYPLQDRARVIIEMTESLTDADITDERPEGVRWEIEAIMLGALTFGGNAFEGGDYLARRTPQRIARDGLDMLRIMYCVEGGNWWGTDVGEFGQQPGDIVVSDFTRPDWIQSRGQTSIILFVGRDALGLTEARLDHAHGLVLRPGGVTHSLLSTYLAGVWARRHQITLEEAPQVEAATVALISELLIRPSPARWTQGHAGGLTTMRVMRFIRENLADPDLGPELLCRHFGLSRAVLYRAFKPLGGVASFIRNLRLRKAYLALRQPGGSAPLGVIAETLGFSSVATLRDAFRHKFGFGPAEARAADGVVLSTFFGRNPERPYMTLPQWATSLRSL
jgi:AraC-like DNA-binding protein